MPAGPGADDRPRTTADPPVTASPTAPPPTAESATPDRRVRVVVGDLPVDATLVWDRVQRMHGTNATAPTVRVVRKEDPTPSEGAGLKRLLGIGPPEPISPSRTGGYVTPEGVTIVLPRGEPDPRVVEMVLAHEYAHVVENSYGIDWGDRTPSLQLRHAVQEGGAVYVETEYARTYLDASGPTYYEREYPDASPYRKWWLAPYALGGRYVGDRVDSPAGLAGFYAHPPRSTEQVLHGYAPDEEKVKPLNATARSRNGTWSRVETPGFVTGYDPDTKGELFVRIALGVSLDDDAAAAGADGWGNDRVLRFEDPQGNRSYAWILRWDDPANATEFREAFARSLDRRGTRAGDAWRTANATFRIERVGKETVVVLAGSPRFVANAAASGSLGNVTVAVP